MDKEFFIKNKKKIIIVVAAIAVSLIGFSLLNSTYSLFYHEKTSKNTEGYSTGTLSITASSKGSTISLSDALPVEDSVGSTSTPYTFTITNTGNLNYKFNIKLLSTGSSSTTIGSQYIKLKVDDGSVTTLSSLSNGIIKKDVTLKAGTSIDINVRVWLSISTPNTQIGKTFNSKIVIDGQAVYTETSQAMKTLDKLNSLNDTIVLATDTPDFTTVSGNNGDDGNGNTNLGDGTKGIYATEDDLGISYYFRGAVENNYVKFANFYWRIIRINGDGTIRMIYAGTSAHPNGYNDSSTRDMDIGDSTYNDNRDDNAYVGYMYGTAGASTYADAHSNTNNSTIKTLIDNWYKTNIVDKGFSNYVADAIYCNDRSLVPTTDTNVNTIFSNMQGEDNTGLGYGSNTTAYGSFKRNYVEHTPSLKCPNNNDKFTTENIGNSKLTYPVALITTDEVSLAGGLTFDLEAGNYVKNQDYYLYNGNYYWTMTPWSFFGGDAFVDSVFDAGLDFGYVNDSSGSGAARAVISLNSNAISVGSGTMTDPFVVG